MARRVFNEPFLMVPYSLLRVPEYGRFFDGAPVGFIYRLLMTGVWRRGIEEIKADKRMYLNENGWVTRLAHAYDEGDLASYFTIAQLEEATAYTPRRIQDFIKKLEELRLVKTEAFGEGIVFILGKRLKHKDFDGYNVGDSHEGYFIDQWESWLKNNPDEFRHFLLDSLAPPKQRSKLLGKIFPDPRKSFSENASDSTREEDRPVQDSSEVADSPIIDNNRIDILNTDSEGLSEEELLRQEAVATLRSAPDWTEKVAAGRQAYANGMLLTDINRLLGQFVPEKYSQYRLFPRFAFRLYAFEHSEKEKKRNDASKLATLWAALHEDTSGVNMTENKSFYKEVYAAYKNHLLKNYSYAQCLWTFKVSLKDKRQADFLASGGRNLFKLVDQNAKRYQELLASQKRAERMEAAQEARQEPKEPEQEYEGPGGRWAASLFNKESND